MDPITIRSSQFWMFDREVHMRFATIIGWIAVVSTSLTGAAAPPVTRCGIEMRNVSLHVAEGVVLEVRTLDGEFISHSKVDPPIFDDPASYTLKMRSADLSLDAASLTNLLQLGLKARPSPLRDVKVTFENGELHASGKLKKGVEVPFSMVATVSAAPDGSMRLHATKMKAIGVPSRDCSTCSGSTWVT
jgi:hypothetical protein